MENATIPKLLAAIERSQLLTDEQLARARQLTTEQTDLQSYARTLVRQELLTRWQAGQLLINRPSFFLGKYKLIDLLGRGGMGSVFLAHHTTMNRRVALKLLSRGLDRNPAAMERFLDEARAAAALDHPNIVRAYNVESADERFFLVMEFVDGRDLARIVEEDGPLAYGQAADFIRQAADGLAHAHQRKMIHCDIKPSNLLVNTQGVVKILDLGLARLAERDENSPPDDKVLGTVDYMAPEQGLGSDKFDHRADIYSLGGTLYFILAGNPPFPGGTLTEKILKHQSEQPRNLLEIRPDAPKELVWIYRKMMAKKPEERFQSAAEVSKALASFNPNQRELKRAAPIAAKPAAPADDDPLAGLDFGSAEPSSRASGVRRTSAHTPKGKKGGSQNLVVYGAIFLVLLMFGVIGGGIAYLLNKSPTRAPAAKPPVQKKKAESELDAARRRWGLKPLDEEEPESTKPPEKPAAKADGNAPKKN